jgi:hypothetical protein
LGYLDGRKPHMYLIVSRLRSLLRPVTVGNLATMFSVVYISIHACLWMDDIGTTVGIFLHNHISKLLYMNMFMCIHIYHSISTYIHKYPALSLSLCAPGLPADFFTFQGGYPATAAHAYLRQGLWNRAACFVISNISWAEEETHGKTRYCSTNESINLSINDADRENCETHIYIYYAYDYIIFFNLYLFKSQGWA